MSTTRDAWSWWSSRKRERAATVAVGRFVFALAGRTSRRGAFPDRSGKVAAPAGGAFCRLGSIQCLDGRREVNRLGRLVLERPALHGAILEEGATVVQRK